MFKHTQTSTVGAQVFHPSILDMLPVNLHTENETDNRKTGVSMVPIDRGHMREIDTYYRHFESEIASINRLKSTKSLVSGVELLFDGNPLKGRPDIIEHVVDLFKHAREWYDKYGFVAIRNVDTARDLALNLIDKLSDTRRHQDTAYETINALMDEARDIVAAIGDPADLRAAVAERKKANETGHGATERGTSGRINDNAAFDVFNGATQPSAKKKRRQQIELVKDAKSSAASTEKLLEGLLTLRPVNLGEGDFVVEVDHVTHERRVWMIERASAQNYRTMFAENANAAFDMSHVDRSVFVHVWPSRMPSTGGMLVTQMREPMRLWRQLIQRDNHSEQVSQANAFPVQVVQTPEIKTIADASRMADSQMFQAGSLSEIERRTSQTTAIGAAAVENFITRTAVEVANRHSESALAVAISHADGGHIDANGNPIVLGPAHARVLKLGPGQTLANAVLPSIIDGHVDINFRYRQSLANALGVPLIVLNGGAGQSSGGSSNGKSGASGMSDAARSFADEKLVTAVNADRRMMSNFASALFNGTVRVADSHRLAELLTTEATNTRQALERVLSSLSQTQASIRLVGKLERKRAMSRDAEGALSSASVLVARLRRLHEDISRSVKAEQRFEARFTDWAFLPRATLVEAREMGAISSLEFVNSQRGWMGMAPLTAAQLKKNLDETFEYAQQMPDVRLEDKRTKETQKFQVQQQKQQHQQQAQLAQNNQVNSADGESADAGESSNSSTASKKRKADQTTTTTTKQ